jgi:hypothetical protein
MLGAIADHLPFSADVLLACIDKRFARKGEGGRSQPKAFAAGATPWRTHAASHDASRAKA